MDEHCSTCPRGTKAIRGAVFYAGCDVLIMIFTSDLKAFCFNLMFCRAVMPTPGSSAPSKPSV
jgi:hypothetical protein